MTLHRQLDRYPDTAARSAYLAITVLATVALYYELYVAGSVSTLILTDLHISFSFFVVSLAVGNLIGAFGSLVAGLTDRLGRTNLVVGGLLITGVLTAFVRQAPGQWKRWYWICFAGAIAFLGCVPLLKGRYSPKAAKADEDSHEAMVQAELAKLSTATT